MADKKDVASEAMKASNTLVLQEGSISAHNTDGIGAVRAILEQSPSSLKGRVLVLGSGGSARGIAFSLLEKGNVESLVIAARNGDAGNEIVDLLDRVRPGRTSFLSLENAERECAEFSLVVHTTPLGMKGKEPGPIFSPSSFNPGQTVFDIVYNPLVTPLVKIARSFGATIIPGTEMLLYQAVEQFGLFTGIQLENELIDKGRQRLRSALHGN
ncbi:shikimate/quinate 5-dehydrogenase [Leptospira fainei serovar Hurstbridge str. BUT 6]|uniref:Shikimate/quinate 5-dehydrogenase n=1 Tax=Leptospira fainei serovar Hurstbridge str. BUT 6 TaxID=1193011 RepID=S3UVM4_9LEPT|nr:shikimate/quinate 5-dehydrogenase [Leptospira fainei serovar Hurstbridge str. BUT 6]